MPEPIQTPVPAADELAAQVLLLAQSRLTADLRFLSSALEQLKPIPVPALDTLFAESEVITLHTNATAENHHLINAESLAKMKDGVLIVNTARGALIDEEALIAALESGKVGGAGLDVVEEENDLVYFNRAGAALPHRTMNILRSMPNVIVSPHNAFYTDVNVASMVESAFKAVRAMADGEQTPLEVRL